MLWWDDTGKTLDTDDCVKSFTRVCSGQLICFANTQADLLICIMCAQLCRPACDLSFSAGLQNDADTAVSWSTPLTMLFNPGWPKQTACMHSMYAGKQLHSGVSRYIPEGPATWRQVEYENAGTHVC